MKVYTFSIGILPIWNIKEMKKIAEVLKSLDGFIGVHNLHDFENKRHATILIFDSYNNAIGGRNTFKFYGNDVGEYILDGELSDDKQTLTIGKPVERS